MGLWATRECDSSCDEYPPTRVPMTLLLCEYECPFPTTRVLVILMQISDHSSITPYQLPTTKIYFMGLFFSFHIILTFISYSLGCIRRNWFSVCYESFFKAQIQWDTEGKPIYTKAEDGKLHITYVFKCKSCLTMHPSFWLVMADSFQLSKVHNSSPQIQHDKQPCQSCEAVQNGQ